MITKNRAVICLKGGLAGASLLLAAAQPAHSANWLLLQGTEKPKAPDHRFWGFIQPQYTNNKAPSLTGLLGPRAGNNGEISAGNLVGPKLENDNAFDFKRARIGWRGKITDKINYFTLFEAANNALTYEPFGGRTMAIAPSDLSLTFNHIDGARIRVGLFKNPGSEESFQGIAAFDYIEFTDFQKREILERFTKGAVSPIASPFAPGVPTPGFGHQKQMGTPESNGYGFSAFRDWGVQVFDSFRKDKWDLSYAIKVGRGEYLYSSRDPDFHPELYLYASGEYDLPGGKGAKKHGVKMYGWYQNGERSFDSDPSDAKYDRTRMGLGFRALGKFFDFGFRHRLSAEYMLAEGMIFHSPDGNVIGGAGSPNKNALVYAVNDGNKSRGYYIDVGFFPTNKWELGFRYDRHDLLYETSADINPGNEREITGWTYALTYYFKPKLKLSFNYNRREAKAPTPAECIPGAFGGCATATNNAQQTSGSLDDRYMLQLSWYF